MSDGHSSNFIDLTGKRFGRLIAKEIAESRNWVVYWKCICDCGNTTTVSSAKLRNGKTRSCGCLRKEMTIERNTKHNLRHKRIYNIYCTMKARCYNPNNYEYHNYGGRGIKVCDEWLGENGIDNFAMWSYKNGYDENADFGKCTIDRIDTNGNYDPNNCRWTTQKVQANNTRTNFYLEHDGEVHSISEWSDILKLDYERFYRALRVHNMSFDEAVDYCVNNRRKQRSDKGTGKTV